LPTNIVLKILFFTRFSGRPCIAAFAQFPPSQLQNSGNTKAHSSCFPVVFFWAPRVLFLRADFPPIPPMPCELDFFDRENPSDFKFQLCPNRLLLCLLKRDLCLPYFSPGFPPRVSQSFQVFNTHIGTLAALFVPVVDPSPFSSIPDCLP